MIECCKGNQSDMEDIVDFANYIFSKNSEPHDFKKLLPKIYSDGNNTAQYHYLIKDDGKIKAMLLAQPFEIKVGDTLINVCGIGTVSVHPYARGCGYMKTLLNTALEDMKNSGCHISVLGGQRQRYEYFGFEPCGMHVNFTVTSTNVKHGYNLLDCSSVVIETIKETDTPMIEAAYQLHKSQTVAGIRSLEHFYKIALSWNSSISSIHIDERFSGYIVRDGSRISELVLHQIDQLPVVLKALVDKCHVHEVYMSVPLFEQEKLAYLTTICEGYKLQCNHSFNVFDYKSVLQAFMQLKASYADMPDGDMTIQIGDETISISVLNRKVLVENSAQKADVALSHLEAMTYFFAPAGDFLKDVVNLPVPAKSWFPLPLYIDSLDCC